MKNKSAYGYLIFMVLLSFNCRSLVSLDSESARYSIIQESKGDINFDGHTDLAIVSTISGSDKGRITIFIADSNGNVSTTLTNDNLTDEFIELYGQLPEIEIKHGELIISYYGGMCHRESRNLIFRFNQELNELFFQTFTCSTHNVCNDSDPTASETSSPELRKIKFTEFKDSLLGTNI